MPHLPPGWDSSLPANWRSQLPASWNGMLPPGWSLESIREAIGGQTPAPSPTPTPTPAPTPTGPAPGQMPQQPAGPVAPGAGAAAVQGINSMPGMFSNYGQIAANPNSLGFSAAPSNPLFYPRTPPGNQQFTPAMQSLFDQLFARENASLSRPGNGMSR